MIVAARAGVAPSISTATATRGSAARCVPLQQHSFYFKSKGPTSLPLPFCNGWTIASRCAYSVSASRRRDGNKAGGRHSVEDGYEDFWGDDDLEEKEEGVDEGDEEDTTIPFDRMNRWLQKKPSGFGEGKTYDVSLEDKLMEEIERSRKAQFANINKLKNSTPQKEQQNHQQQHQQKQMEAAEVAPGVFRVRIGNLPKKKNIHRDLKLTFDGSRDILSISPAVTGNKKTREPVCKGFAFVDFRSREAAERFVEKYSNQSLAFGKVTKHIVCHIMNQSKLEELGDSWSEAEQQLGDVSKEFVDSCDDDAQGIHGNQINNEVGLKPLLQGMSSRLVDGHMIMEDASLAAAETLGKPDRGNAADIASRHLSSVETQNKRSTRRKSGKKPIYKLKVGSLGSATRLKSKERTVLAGVLSKYSGEAVAALSTEK